MAKKRIAALLSAAVLACSLSITGFGATQETEAGSDIKTASSGETVEFVILLMLWHLRTRYRRMVSPTHSLCGTE